MAKNSRDYYIPILIKMNKLEKRYKAYVGFVTTPRYFDDAPQQFLMVAPPKTGVMQRVNYVDSYAYELKQRARNFNVLEESAICLGESHCQVVGQSGTNWVHCNGTSPEDIVRICDEISEKANARFFMAGQCVVDGLKALGAKKIAVVNGYYRDDWAAGINGYLTNAGFEILWAGDLIKQGIVSDHQEKLEIEEKTHWDYPDDMMIAAVEDIHKRAPGADAIVQTGSGFRMLPITDNCESITGKPLVASDTALYWAMLKEMGLSAESSYGYLLASLN